MNPKMNHDAGIAVRLMLIAVAIITSWAVALLPELGIEPTTVALLISVFLPLPLLSGIQRSLEQKEKRASEDLP